VRDVKCPSCGSEITRKYPIVSLDRNEIAWGDKSVKVCPRTAEIMSVIVECAPNIATRERLMIRVFGHGHPSEHLDNLLWRHIALLRVSLKIIGVDLRTSVGRGYYLG
jgi:DNA-binding winged helix-turn-helix (wHTH) protein